MITNAGGGSATVFGLAGARPATGTTYVATDTGVVSYYDTANQTWYSVGQVSTYDQAVLEDNPVTYYELLETGGTAAADAAGNNSGVWSSAPTRSAGPGNTGNGAVTLDGTSGPILAVGSGSPADLQLIAPLTLEALVNLGGVLPANNAYIHYGTANGAFKMAISPAGNLQMVGNFTTLCSSTIDITDAAWHHVALTVGGTAAAPIYKSYIDGQDVTTGAGSAALIAPGTVSIGGNSAPGNFKVHKPAIYASALPPARILAHFEAIA